MKKASAFGISYKRILAGIALCLLQPQWAFAWGDEGHEVIGIIAYGRLTPAVKTKVDALLGADKDTLTAPDFVSRTTWADKYRDSDRNTTRIRYEATRNWHFVDIEITDGNIDAPCNNHPKLPPNTPASAGPAKACLLDKINQFAAEVRNPMTAKAERILALKFLMHFIGDLHQPLHSADNKDRGGNDVPVVAADNTKTNLHSYWDTNLVKTLAPDQRAFGKLLAKQITQAQATNWSTGSAVDWAKGSFDRAKRVVYDFTGEEHLLDELGATAVRLDKAYDSRALPVVREQLSKGGVRLATLLNNLLK